MEKERLSVIDENGVLWGNLKTEPIEGFEWGERLSSTLAEPIRAFSVKMWLLGLGASSFSPCIPSLAVLETWHMLNTCCTTELHLWPKYLSQKWFYLRH